MVKTVNGKQVDEGAVRAVRAVHSGEMNLFLWARLKVADVMSRDVVSVTPEQTLQVAAQILLEKRISCMTVLEGNQICGILTQKDLMHAAQTGDVNRGLRVRDKMSHPIQFISPETPVFYASMLLEEKGIKRLPVVSEGRLVGIVTQTELVRAFESMSALKSVTEIMSAEVATMTPDQSVAAALDIMTTHKISSVIVVQEKKAIGILTEKDILRAVLAPGKDPAVINAMDVMSFPLITVTPSHSVLSASRLMDDKHVHRLVVCNEEGVCGILTRTDVMKGLQTWAQAETQQSLHLLTHSEDSIFMLDAEQKTTYINPALLKLFKTDAPDVFINQPFPPESLWVNPEDRYRYEKQHGWDDTGIQEFLLKTVTGDYLSVVMCFTTIHDVKGHPIGKQGVVWDLSKDIL